MVMERFAEGCFTGIRYQNGVLYAAKSDKHASPPCQIYTHASNTTRPLAALSCDSDHLVKLEVGKDLVYASCKEDNAIFVFSKDSGTLMQKITTVTYVSISGPMTSEDHTLNGPSINQIDENDSLLVLEKKKQISLLLADGKWCKICTSKDVDKPVGTVYFDGKLFVANDYKTLFCFEV